MATQTSKHGISLLSSGDATVLKEALCCFEAAILLRRDLPLDDYVWFRWGLCAGWMNRGDVLTRLGNADFLPEAVRSYDEALVHLEKIPPSQISSVVGRHVLAWMNRALTLRAQRTAESLAEALRSLDQAKTLLEAHPVPDLEMDAMIQASLARSLPVNRAAVLLEVSPPRLQEAMAAAEEALALCQPLESTDLRAAEAGLKARHIFCHAVAMLLESPPVDTRRADDWILQATERVEEALALTAKWAEKGHAFGELRLELFHYGCRIYLAYQPHFMAEFLLDVLDPERGSSLLSQAEDLHAAGLEALAMAAEVLKRRGPLDFGLQGVDRLIEAVESLHKASERIKNLPKGIAAG